MGAIDAAQAKLRALIDTGKEVMPDDQTSNSTHPRSDIGPGDQAVAGAAKFALDRIREWESDNLTDGTERDWHGHVGPALARLASTLDAQPEPVGGSAPRRASGPIDPEAGFATSGAEARWIEDVDAGIYDDANPEPVAGAAPVTVQEAARVLEENVTSPQYQDAFQEIMLHGLSPYKAHEIIGGFLHALAQKGDRHE
jgi:hypothetical protein